MWEQKGNNKKSHRAGAWRQMDHTLVDHALVARANFAVWPRKKKRANFNLCRTSYKLSSLDSC